MVKNILRCYCEYEQSKWEIQTLAAEFAYNSTSSEDLRASPFQIWPGTKASRSTSLDSRSKTTCGRKSRTYNKTKGDSNDEAYAHELAKANKAAEETQLFKNQSYKYGDKVLGSQKLIQDDYT